jgi:hypothetical protein
LEIPLPDYSFAETLLSFFTSPDRAATIAGDFAEEAQRRGSFWFWRQVVQTAVSLSFRQIGAAPAQLALLFVAGNMMIDWAPHFKIEAVQKAVADWNEHTLDPANFTLTHLLMTRVVGSIMTGLALAALSREREVMVCGAVALSRPLLFLFTWARFADHGFPLTWPVLLLNSLSPILLVAAAVFVRRSNLRALRVQIPGDSLA